MNARDDLIRLAARVARREGFLAPDDARRMSREEINDCLIRQDDRVADLAYELGMLARSLPGRAAALDRPPPGPIDWKAGTAGAAVACGAAAGLEPQNAIERTTASLNEVERMHTLLL